MPFNKIIQSWINPSVGAQLIAPHGPRPSRAQLIAPLRRDHSPIIFLKRIIAPSLALQPLRGTDNGL